MSVRLPSLKPTEVIRVLERNGYWRITKRKKHRIYTDGLHIIPVPYHSRDLKPGTLRSIIRQAGWTIEQFLQKL
jgi:predicted RNA binding protein YcfA (HicA-like mRNA interferase family)